MREILFRGRAVSAHRWVEGSYFYEGRYDSHWILTFDGQHTVKHLVDPATVGQYTGLTDKNGTRIFEGDIVEYRHSFMNRCTRCAIKYDGVGFVGDGFFMTHHDNPSDIWGEGTRHLEVIGNIHESPLEALNNEEAPERAGEG